jgi:hypothetical protein
VPDDTAAALKQVRDAQEQLGLCPQEVWSLYLAVGGNGTLDEVEAWLAGGSPVPKRDVRYLVVALSDELIGRGQPGLSAS